MESHQVMFLLKEKHITDHPQLLPIWHMIDEQKKILKKINL